MQSRSQTEMKLVMENKSGYIRALCSAHPVPTAAIGRQLACKKSALFTKHGRWGEELKWVQVETESCWEFSASCSVPHDASDEARSTLHHYTAPLLRALQDGGYDVGIKR